MREDLKVVDDESNAAQRRCNILTPRVLNSVFGLPHSRRPQKAFGLNPSMHFSFYLMIAALVILGVGVAYALYQLANFFL